MVHQELNLVRQRNIMDNIWLGRYPQNGLMIDEKRCMRILKNIRWARNRPRSEEKVSKLSVSQMQMIEIAKAVSYNSKIIVMDEPTSSLTEKEVAHLLE